LVLVLLKMLILRSSDWVLPLVEKSFLDGKLAESTFPLRTGLHIENRTGMVNYSIVGRNATMGERKLYASYDNEHNERNKIASEFNNLFPNLQATVGGETGIDIAPRGNDKSQILRDFDPNDELHFFGDAMHKEGNDYPLKRKIIDNNLGMCYTVIDWKHTWELLKQHD
jgi:phosphomannomutase